MRPRQNVERRPSRLGVPWLAVALLGLAGGAAADEPQLMRLRMSLQCGQQPMPWRGAARVTDGEVLAVEPLSLDPVSAAGASLDAGRLALHHRRPQAVDYVDLTVAAQAGAELVVELKDPSGQPLQPARLSLDGVRQFEPQTASIDTQRSVRIDRLPSDRLRIDLGRDSLILSPQEGLAFAATARPEGAAPGETVVLTATLGRGREGAAVWTSEPQRVELGEDGSAQADFELSAPAEEGVYTLRVRTTRPARLGSRLIPIAGAGPTVLAEQSLQLLVFDARAEPTGVVSWEEVYAFDPRSQRWADRVPAWLKWRGLPWFAAGPLASEPGARRSDAGGDWVQIAPAPAPGEAHWRAYPLPIESPGSPYAIEVQTAGEPGDTVTIGLLEPDALGDLRSAGGAVTRVVPRWNRDSPPPATRLWVRPRTSSPLLVIANPNPERAARIGRVRLLRGVRGERPPAAGERLVALDWPDADLGHAVGASHATGVGPYEVADMVTHWQTARGLADRVEAAGANAAVIPVNRDGAAIFPSRYWRSPRYDLTTWSDSIGRAPRRELLRIIAMEFARRGLRITPAVRFDAPTPAIEAADSAPLGDRSPYYDALADPIAAVREAIVDEVVDAAGPGAPLAGIAIRVDPNGWAVPSDETLGSVAASRAAYQAAMARLADRLAERGLPADPLMILPAELAARPSVARRLSPRLRPNDQDHPASARLLVGLGKPMVATPIGLSEAQLTSHGADSRALLASLAVALESDRSAAALAVHAARRPLRLTNSALQLGRAEADDSTDVFLPTIIADDTPEASALAAAAADGVPRIVLDTAATAGWYDEAAVRQRRRFARLPPGGTGFASNGADVAAVANTTPEGSVISITNRTPWTRKAELTVRTEQRARGGEIADRPGEVAVGEAWFTPGRHVLSVELAPHATRVWRFSGSPVAVDGLRIDPQSAAQKELAVALEDLRARDTTSRRELEAIENPSFEADPGSPVAPGWELGAGASVESGVAFDGSSSLVLRAGADRTAEAVSAPFRGPSTGQLVLFVRAAPVRLEKGSRLWVGVEQTDGPYRNGAPLDGERLTAAEPSDGEGGWLPPIFVPIDDLPLGDSLSLRVRLALEGPGEVRLDQLRAEDLLLPRDGYAQLNLREEKLALVRLYKNAEDLLAQGRLEDCRDLLDGYWARFLLRNFPRRDAEPPASAQGPLVNETPPAREEAQPTPSLSERVRGWFSWR
ncbi:hypothetical protein [Botrimarina sp.]|uniref:hypothetical protein n=1 Tax=Botrimarina sp. TaxID=2795802 RepID=UPI0032EC382D